MAPTGPGDLAIEVTPPAGPRARAAAILIAVTVGVSTLLFGVTLPLLNGSGVRWGRLFFWFVIDVPLLLWLLRIALIGQTVYLREEGLVLPRFRPWPRRIGWGEVESVGLDGEPPWTTAVVARLQYGADVRLMEVEAPDADTPKVRRLIDTATERIERYHRE